jgi:S-adenosylmethionine synthetase
MHHKPLKRSIAKDLEVQVAELVTLGHPDTVSDYIAAAIVDAHLAEDPFAHVAVDVAVSHDHVLVTGEIASSVERDLESVVRHALADLGFNDPQCALDHERVPVITRVRRTPRVTDGPPPFLPGERSGIVHGFATHETPDERPAAAWIAHLVKANLETRGPSVCGPVNGRIVVGVEHDERGDIEEPAFVTVELVQPERVGHAELVKSILDEVVSPALLSAWRGGTFPVRVHVRPNDDDAVVGFHGRSGRHAIRAGYGGATRTSDSVVSGRTPDHLEVLHAYTARWLALHAVRAGRADRLELGLESIASGAGTHIHTNAFGTGHLGWIGGHLRALDTAPETLVQRFGLRRPIHRDLVRHGWMGRPELPWEQGAA